MCLVTRAQSEHNKQFPEAQSEQLGIRRLEHSKQKIFEPIHQGPVCPKYLIYTTVVQLSQLWPGNEATLTIESYGGNVKWAYQRNLLTSTSNTSLGFCWIPTGGNKTRNGNANRVNRVCTRHQWLGMRALGETINYHFCLAVRYRHIP